jgi:hypothetical protein
MGIPGYTHGTQAVSRSPATLADFEQMKRSVEKMYAAWVKSCLLQVTLWSHPYVKDGDF